MENLQYFGAKHCQLGLLVHGTPVCTIHRTCAICCSVVLSDFYMHDVFVFTCHLQLSQICASRENATKVILAATVLRYALHLHSSVRSCLSKKLSLQPKSSLSPKMCLTACMPAFESDFLTDKRTLLKLY